MTVKEVMGALSHSRRRRATWPASRARTGDKTPDLLPQIIAASVYRRPFLFCPILLSRPPVQASPDAHYFPFVYSALSLPSAPILHASNPTFPYLVTSLRNGDTIRPVT